MVFALKDSQYHKTVHVSAAKKRIHDFSRFIEEKIRVLEKLKNKVTDTDKDLIIGMINDYLSHLSRLN